MAFDRKSPPFADGAKGRAPSSTFERRGWIVGGPPPFRRQGKQKAVPTKERSRKNRTLKTAGCGTRVKIRGSK